MKAELARAEALARKQFGVASRRQLYALGVSRWQIQAQVRARRWKATGRQTVAIHGGALDSAGLWSRAVLETGPRAALDGVTGLLMAGLTGLDDPTIHVIVPKSSEPRRTKGVHVHESRRFREADVLSVPIRRVRPAVAAVHAALWARTDRQAALFLVMTVQQGLASVAEVEVALAEVRRHPRRKHLRLVLADIAGGSQSLGELDVLKALRRRGLPMPSRQATRRLSSGRVYLDLEWPEWGLVVEIDGAQHDDPRHRLADLLRDLEVTAGGRTVLRIPLLAWRLDQEAVLDRLTDVLVARGWTRYSAA